LGIKDDRGKLFFEMVRVLKDKKPSAFIAENVKGILSANKREAFPLILKEFENAGYNVMYELLSHFIYPIITPKEERDNSEERAVLLIPSQFLYEDLSIYDKVLGIIDYVSGMTDNYATDLYRKIKGIDIGMTI